MSSQPSVIYDVSLSDNPRDFPTRQKPFIDRENELAKVLRFLNPIAGPRGIYIYGQGGVGKTTLAIEAAYRSWQRRDYDDLIFLTAKVQDWDVRTASEITVNRGMSKRRFATFSGMLNKLVGLVSGGELFVLRGKDNEQKLKLIRDLLADRGVLIILDNIDTIQSIKDINEISDFVNFGIPQNSKAIITSREGLREVIGQGFVEIKLEPFDETYTYYMLTKLLEENDITLSYRDADRIIPILVESGGIPLIIKQVASMISEIGIEQAISRIEGSQKRLLSFMFDTGLASIRNDSRKILYIITLASIPVDIRYISSVLKISPTEASKCIDELERWSLIQRSGRFYDMHFLLKDYIVQHLRRDERHWDKLNQDIQKYEDSQLHSS